MRLQTRSGVIEFPRLPLIMGIVNLSPDSFSGDGVGTVEEACARAEQAIAEGADIIDVGAESAGTQRSAISADEETERLCRFLERWRERAPFPPDRKLVSINTWRPEVARAALQCGADILNDIGGLPTDENARICAAHQAALVIMHSVGEPKVKHTHIHYEDVITTIADFFRENMAAAILAGLPTDAVILDPGIDFAKQREDNLRIYRDLAEFQQFERPILMPVSRKTVIGEVLGLPDARDRDAGTAACIVSSVLRGARILRVHNVRSASQVVRTVAAASGLLAPS